MQYPQLQKLATQFNFNWPVPNLQSQSLLTPLNNKGNALNNQRTGGHATPKPDGRMDYLTGNMGPLQTANLGQYA